MEVKSEKIKVKNEDTGHPDGKPSAFSAGGKRAGVGVQGVGAGLRNSEAPPPAKKISYFISFIYICPTRRGSEK